MTVCVIPARKGSKRLPGKNRLLFQGKPLVLIAAERALESKIFNRIIVNTDDPLIILLFDEHPLIECVMRPSHLGDDEVRADDVVRWQIAHLQLDLSEVVCCLLPTTPGLTSIEISMIYREFMQSPESPLFGVIKVNQTPFRNFLMMDDKRLIPLFPEKLLLQSHEYPATYLDAGQLYFANVDTWNKTFSITSNSLSRGYPLSAATHPDINTAEDWEYFILNQQSKEG